MDREQLIRVIVAMILSAALILGWNMLFGPKPGATAPAAAAANAALDPANAANVAATQKPAGETTPPIMTAAPPPAASPAASAARIAGDPSQPPLELKTKQWTLTCSARGARVLFWKLNGYSIDPTDPNSPLVDMVSPESRDKQRDGLALLTGDAALDQQLAESWYRVTQSTVSEADAAAKAVPVGTHRLLFEYADQQLEVSKALYLPDEDSYLARVEWSVKRGGQPVPASISWGPSVSRTELHETRGHIRGHVKLPGEQKEIDPLREESDRVFGPGQLSWLAIDDAYFAVAFLTEPQADARVRFFATPQGGPMQARQASIEVGGGAARIFVGPKQQTLLSELDRRLGLDLSKLVPWGFFGPVARPLYGLVAFLHGLLSNWGIAIVIVTVMIRAVFYLPTQKAMVSMRKTQTRMAKLQPKLKKLKEKFEGKKDMESRRLMNEEMMALYSKEGINPLATLTGCLPMLFQLPVLYAMYTVLSVPIELRGAPFFGWIHDLSIPDPFGILTIVMGITMLIQQFLAMTKTEDPQMKAQQRMMLIMPVMFMFFFWKMPAGLVLYWLINNLVGIAQQYLINKQADAALAKS